MKILFSIILSCFLQTVIAQKVIISGKEGNRPLVWSDFTGKPDNSISYFAMTYWTLNYGFSNVQFKGETVVIGSFDVKLELNGKGSWVKKGKESVELLVHEQGHFNTGLLCLKEMIRREKEMAPTFTRKNFSEKIQTLFNEVMKKYHDMGIQYDEESDHSKNKQGQEKWNAFFAEQLAL
jgi:hypothetical protein